MASYRTKINRTDPDLWEACKHEAVDKMGRFSARAMQHAVVLYKSRGGGYVGEKPTHSGLEKWSDKKDKKFFD